MGLCISNRVVGRVTLPPGTHLHLETIKAKNNQTKKKKQKIKIKEKKELNIVLPYNMYCSYGRKVSGYLPQDVVFWGRIMLGVL